MGKQKVFFSIITATILGLAYPSTSSAQGQVQQNMTVEVVTAYDECRDKYDLQRPAEVPVECVYKLVSHEARWLSGWVNEWQGLNLEALKSAYPYYGIGIRLSNQMVERTNELRVFGVFIYLVWDGSPADMVGLRSGDRLLSVNAVEIPLLEVRSDLISKEEDNLVNNAISKAKETIANARDPFTMGVEREGQVIDVELSKTTLGQEVADVLNRNLGRIESTNVAVKDMVEELVRQVEISKDDKETLLHLYDQLLELDWYQDGPFVEVLYAEKWKNE